MDQVKGYLQPGKVVVIYGPRRVGKTTLLRQLREQYGSDEILWLEGEQHEVKQQLSSHNLTGFQRLIGRASIVIIDEAQAVPQIGMALKMLVDHLPHLKIIASGSATFDLARKIGEPLVGRKWTVWMYPLWAKELMDHYGPIAFQAMTDELLVFGSYPALLHLPSAREKQDYLLNLVDSALYREILELDSVRNSAKVRQLLQLLALQIGHEVSLHELARALAMGGKTVARYLDLLEQSFVIMRVGGYSRNLRKEITRSARYYFLDNGVRNALINNFNRPDPLQRNDVGMLWENWLVMERIKKQRYRRLFANNYFWRTYDQKEIDWVEEREGKLFGHEFSWRAKPIRKATRQEFLTAYPQAELTAINRENFLDFIL